MPRWGEKVGDPVVDWILYPAGRAAEFPFKNLLVVLLVNMDREIALADRAADNIQKGPFHASSSRKSIIWVTSGPVEMRVIGQPMSSSAVLRKSFAFLVSFL